MSRAVICGPVSSARETCELYCRTVDVRGLASPTAPSWRPCSLEKRCATVSLMQNLEYKAELRDIGLARSICRALGATAGGVLLQTDTYYNAADARFKRRETEVRGVVKTGDPSQEKEHVKVEYILYHRKDRTAPKISRYEVLTEEETRGRFGAREFTPWAVVKKRRELYLHKNVRIHLDEVEGLGEPKTAGGEQGAGEGAGMFLEFEVLVTPRWNLRRCHELMKAMKERFMPVLGEAVSCGYVDLVMRAKEI